MLELNETDYLLGQAIEILLKSAGLMKDNKELNDCGNVKSIGRIVAEIWKIRDSIYEIDPDLKRDFLVELESDPVRFDILNGLFNRAHQLEEDGRVKAAQGLYEELHYAAKFGYFRLLAEAGLYRVSVERKPAD